MSVSCEVIGDLLPLYVEGLASPDSRRLVEEHLGRCTSCKAQYERMKKPQKISPPASGVPLKRLKRHLFKKKAETVLLVAALVCSVMVIAFACLTAPNYIPYSKNVVSCNQKSDGTLLVTFRKDVTRYSIHYFRDENGAKCADIRAWNTILDRFFPHQTLRTALTMPESGPVELVWYCTGGRADTLIFGDKTRVSYSMETLPRLLPGFYAFIALALAAAGGLLLILFRKNQKIRNVLEKAIGVPVSYLIGTFCVKGFSTESYAPLRDLCLILLAAVFVYGALFSGLSVCRKFLREKRRNF